MMALVLWYGGHRVLEGRIEWGVLVAMLQYVPRFFMPLRDIAERYGTVQSAMASSERVFELLDAEPETYLRRMNRIHAGLVRSHSSTPAVAELVLE